MCLYLATHGVLHCQQSLQANLTTSNFVQGHRYNITLILPSEEIHLMCLLRTQKYSQRSSKGGMGISLYIVQDPNTLVNFLKIIC